MHTQVHTGTHMCTQTHTYTQCIVSLGATGNSRLKTPGHLNQGVTENLDKFERKEEEEWHKIAEALQREFQGDGTVITGDQVITWPLGEWADKSKALELSKAVVHSSRCT